MSLSGQRVYGKWGGLGDELLQTCQNLIIMCAKEHKIILSFGLRKNNEFVEGIGVLMFL